jgi:predicted TIM-barrel fold metal-dependent hydrolase
LSLIANQGNFSVKLMQATIVDAHTHLGRWLAPDGNWMASDLAGATQESWMQPDVGALLELMDGQGVAACVNLDGRWDDELEANLDRYDRAHPDRFLTFCQLDWRLASEGDDFGETLAASLRRSAGAGARGLKVWKTLGLGFRDARGRLLLPGDPRAAVVFATAGELGLPVLIHTADPVAFWDPVDAANERFEMLLEHPEWSYAGGAFPSHARLMESFEALVAEHPGTTFIGAHVAGNVEDLDSVTRVLVDHPNLFVDVSARLPELAVQPDAARRLMHDHPGRVLFGTDELPLSAEGYRAWSRFLGGLGLPEDGLRAIYSGNAERLLNMSERRAHAGQA